MMRILLCALVLGCFALPAHAFVEELNPYGGPIPCHQMRAAVVELIAGTFTAPTLATALEGKYLTPVGHSWTVRDTTDNTNLKALVDAASGTANKTLIALRIESLCAAAEDGFAVVDTAAKFRTLLGLPAIP